MKFKIWDSENKIFAEAWKFMVSSDCELYKHNDQTFKYESVVKRQFTTVYSTGQNDKNKIEIYDGDIFGSKIDQRMWLIEHNGKGVWAARLIGGHGSGPLDNDYASSLSIRIGNKFENPELLE